MDACGCVVVAVVVVVVSTLNHPFSPASSVDPVPVLIPYPREILIMWSQTLRQRKTEKYNNRKLKCHAASEVSAYRVREHNNTSRTGKIGRRAKRQ